MTDPADTRWMDRAACRTMTPVVFFPSKGEATVANNNRIRHACGPCPVRTECLEYALANNIRFGTWGGTSERERARIRKRTTWEGDVMKVKETGCPVAAYPHGKHCDCWWDEESCCWCGCDEGTVNCPAGEDDPS